MVVKSLMIYTTVRESDIEEIHKFTNIVIIYTALCEKNKL